MENPILSLPNMTRNSSVVSQGDIMNFFQCLRFDPKVVAADHKSSHQRDFKQHIDVALGISMDDFGSSKGKMLASCRPEEIKKVKAGLRESSVKARERVKIFNEALSVFNKFFPSVPSKKRSRLEGFSSNRADTLLSSDRLVMGPSLGKMGVQNHVVTSSIELEQQKPAERPRNNVPNKRTRTSLVDMRMHMQSNAQAKPSGVVDRDREISRPVNSIMTLPEVRTTFSICVDGLEKTKMNKKRSGIKPGVSTSITATKPTDSYRESKPGLQQRPITDSRSRLDIDNNGLRLGISNGTVGVGKLDGAQPTGLSMKLSIPRADLDSSSLMNERKERPTGSDKDGVNFKAVNKANLHDEINSSSPSSSTKINAIRAPRSSTGIAPKSSTVLDRATGPNEWELSHCANKPTAHGANNRKRSAVTRSSSPPVARWAGQRPKKISRTARRTNLVPIVPSNEENAALDVVSHVSGNDTGLGFARPLNTNSPQPVKMKGEPSAATLSDSEESGAPESKSKEKEKRFEEMEVGQSLQKLSRLEMASRKNKKNAKEELGGGVRRQGRSGRDFASTRSLAPVGVENPGNMGTPKQIGSTRLGFDKNGSKPGCPTRKPSDRKAYTRQKRVIANASADFRGSDDGNEELLAAASDVINPGHGISGPFWRKMERFFGFIFDDDIAYLKQQGKLELPSPIPSDVSNCWIGQNGNGTVEDETEGPHIEASSFEISKCSEPVARDTPLFQRLLTAIIPEEDDIERSVDWKLDAYGTGFHEDEDLESNLLNNLDYFQLSGFISNGCDPSLRLKNSEAEVGLLETPTMGSKPTLSPRANGFLSDQTMMPGRPNAEFDYGDLHINEKLHLEVQSVGISIEPTIEDGGISEEISNLEEKHHRQTLKKKGLLDKLLNSAMEAKELHKREFERCAHEKLVTRAYRKYMACPGPPAPGGKGSRNKMAKQAALAFVKWTLLQCHKFEDTGKSCFIEPVFMEMFLVHTSHRIGIGLDAPTDGESSKQYANSSSHSLEGKVSVSISSQPSPQTSWRGQTGDNNIASSPDLLPHVSTLLAEQDPSNEDAWLSRMKRRELLLDDVGGGMVGNSPISRTKGKRSERDREGKVGNRVVVSRSGTTKLGRPALSNAKGERKSKTKSKHKIAQLFVSLNGPVGKIPEQPKSALPSESASSGIIKHSGAKEKDGLGLDVLNDPEDIVFSNLLGMDDGQGNDLGAWLNIDDDGLHDHDFMGLEIPMDDLSDLNMMV